MSGAAISLWALIDTGATELTDALGNLGIAVNQDADFLIAITPHYLLSGLLDLNRACLSSGRRWMLIKPTGDTPWIGPIFWPGRTPCWECLARQLRENGHVSPEDSPGREHSSRREAPLRPASVALAANVAALEIAKSIPQGGRSLCEGAVLSLDAAKGDLRVHALRQGAECPACGSHAGDHNQQTHSVLLQHTRKVYTKDGGHRVCTPDQTLQRVRRLISPITGIIPGIAVRKDGDGEVVSTRTVLNCAAQAGAANSRVSRLAVVGGKGMTPSQAKASCAGEAIERYSSMFRPDTPRVRRRYEEIRDRAVHPSSLLQFSATQYLNRDASNRAHGRRNWVPEPFDEAKEICWTSAWSLSEQELRFLPTAWCYLGYPCQEERRYIYSDTNGCASGNVLEEAILQGLLEVIERDATAIWWYNRLSRQAVNLESFEEPFFLNFKKKLERRGRELCVLDITSDLGIPVIAAVSWTVGGRGIALGLGAHLEARVSVARALTELAQTVARLSAPDRPAGRPQNPESKDDLLRWAKQGSMESEVYLRPRSGPAASMDHYPRMHSDDLLEDIQTCLALLEARNLPVIILNLTRPGIGFPAVKVVVPGMRHFRCRFAPGRLYDVPVDQGWLKEPKWESDLNPVPFVL